MKRHWCGVKNCFVINQDERRLARIQLRELQSLARKQEARAVREPHDESVNALVLDLPANLSGVLVGALEIARSF